MTHVKHVFSSKDDLSDGLGTFIVDCCNKAVAERGRFTVAFSGGSAATGVCACMNLPKFNKAVQWDKWHIFFCDERFVELTHSDSNFKAINEGLLEKIEGIDRTKVFALEKSGTVQDAATSYEKAMRGVFENESVPMFDLLVLGMGPDGHICSLFPDHALLKEESSWVGSLCDSPKPPPERITFTLKVVNNARNVLFYTTGKGKAENIHKAIEEAPSSNIPASLVKPVGEVHWFMDTDAASLLKAE